MSISAPILALVCLIVSFVLAIINNDLKSSSLWALWAICVALITGGRIASIH
jgi:hypothetical protein